MDNKNEQVGFQLERRVSLIEYKLDEFPNKLNAFSEKIEKHERKSEELWAKMVQCLEDIKDEISDFKMSKIEDSSNLKHDIQDLKTKIELIENSAKSTWKTIVIISVILSSCFSAGYTIFSDFNNYHQEKGSK